MVKRKPEISKIKKMLKKSERIYTNNKIYTQKVYLDTKMACKLEILSYLEAKSKSEILRKAIRRYIRTYESKNGSLLNRIRRQ